MQSIPKYSVDEATQYFLAFTWEEKQFTSIVMLQSFTESLFLPNIKGLYEW